MPTLRDPTKEASSRDYLVRPHNESAVSSLPEGARPSFPHETFIAIALSGDDADLEMAIAALWEQGCLGSHTQDDEMVVYFPKPQDGPAAEHYVTLIKQIFPNVRSRELADVHEADWDTVWKTSLTGSELAASFYVLPSWLPEPATPRRVLRIDPKRAFGTGTHETTRLCAQAIETLTTTRTIKTLIDVGTGTGILAMVAAFCGVQSVLGIEPDRDAFDCAVENIQAHGLEGVVRLENKGYAELDEQADMIVANLHLFLLESAIPSLGARLSPNGILVVSGILVEQLDELRSIVHAHELEVISNSFDGMWAAACLSPAPAGGSLE